MLILKSRKLGVLHITFILHRENTSTALFSKFGMNAHYNFLQPSRQAIQSIQIHVTNTLNRNLSIFFFVSQ